MKRNIFFYSLIIALSLIALPSFSAHYAIDKAHSRVGFKVSHLVVATVTGQFDEFKGGFDFDEKTLTLKAIHADIDVKSINTNEKQRDDHLRSPDFFNAEKFPQMTFKSTKIEMKDKKPALVMGDLSMAGITKPVTLKVNYKGMVTDLYGNQRLVFEASTQINRMDWGVKWNKTLDKGGLAVGNEVQILIEGEAIAGK